MKPGMSLLKHYLQFRDFRVEEYAYLFERSREIKKRFKNYEKYTPLVDRTLAMIFEKASTRTRVSFEAGMYQMGGSVVNLTTTDSQLGRAEPVEDTARVISRMVDIVMIRTYEQAKLDAFAANSRVPVINGLTNEYHPCQILADVFTCIERLGSIEGKTVAWVGDGNNMAATWLQAADILDFTLHLSTPGGYEVDAAAAGVRRADCFRVFRDPLDACRNAHVVTTDVWTSMGYEAESAERRKAFADWCVDREMMAVADPGALFMHCLPAHRGEEVDGRGHRRPAIGRLGRGREPPARAEGADGVPGPRPHRLIASASTRQDRSSTCMPRARRAMPKVVIATPMQATAMPSHIVAVGATRNAAHSTSAATRRREIEQARHAGRLAVPHQQVQDRVGADRAEDDVVRQRSRDRRIPGDRESLDDDAERQHHERGRREMDADGGTQVAARAELALVQRPGGHAEQRAEIERTLDVVALPARARSPTTRATPARPTPTPTFCSVLSRSCSQRETITAVSSGCSARTSAVTPADNPQLCA